MHVFFFLCPFGLFGDLQVFPQMILSYLFWNGGICEAFPCQTRWVPKPTEAAYIIGQRLTLLGVACHPLKEAAEKLVILVVAVGG